MYPILLYVLVFLSGFTGVSYQVTWQKYLNMYMGAHSFSVALILSVFFLFLSLGYLVISKYYQLISRKPIWFYGILEGVIGVYALLSPIYCQWLLSFWPRFPVGTAADIISGILFTMTFIGFPTFLMGGTIPVLVEGMSPSDSSAPRVHSKVYGINTFGAFAGAIFTGYLFIDVWGLPLTLMNLGLLNLIIFTVIYFMKKWRSIEGFSHDIDYSKVSSKDKKFLRLVYVISFLFGYVTFSMEGLVIRLTSMLLGSSQYTYTLVISCFVLSIAIGSYYANHVKRGMLDKVIVFQQVAIGFSFLIFYVSIPELSYWSYRMRATVLPVDSNFGFFQVLQFVFLFAILLIPVSLLGMNIPLLFAKLKTKLENISPVVGGLYFWNSLGSFFGAMLGGYILLKFFDDRFSFKLSIAISFLCLLLYIVVFLRRFKYLVMPVLGLLAVLLSPNWDDEHLIPGSFLVALPAGDQSPRQMFAKAREAHDIIFSELDPNTLVHVTEDKLGKNRSVYVNGKPDAATGADDRVRAYNAIIPLLLSKDHQDIFVIGIGAGLSLSIFSDFEETKSVRVAEISSGVVKALPYFDKFNNHIFSRGLPKIEIINDDAFKVLQQENKQYDIIVCEPSNPWVNGVENLYTIEFLRAGKARLKEGGIYGQWFPSAAISNEVFLSVLSNFKQLYSWTSVFSEGGGAFLILASDHKPNIKMDVLESRFKALNKSFQLVGFENARQALMSEVLSDPIVSEVSKDATEHSMEFPIVGAQSARNVFSGKNLTIGMLLEKNLFQRDTAQNLGFLYHQIENHIVKSDREFILNRYLHPELKFHRDRFRFELLDLFGEDKKLKIGQDSYQKWKIITGKQKASVEQMKASKEELESYKTQFNKIQNASKKYQNFEEFMILQDRQKLLGIMKSVYDSFSFVDVKNAARYFPDKCSNEDCVFQKLEFLRLSRIADKSMYPITKRQLEGGGHLAKEIESYFNQKLLQ